MGSAVKDFAVNLTNIVWVSHVYQKKLSHLHTPGFDSEFDKTCYRGL